MKTVEGATPLFFVTTWKPGNGETRPKDLQEKLSVKKNQIKAIEIIFNDLYANVQTMVQNVSKEGISITKEQLFWIVINILKQSNKATKAPSFFLDASKSAADIINFIGICITLKKIPVCRKKPYNGKNCN